MAGGELLEQWMQSLQPAVLRAVRESLRNAEPALLEWNWGKCLLASTRDLQDPASPRRICGFNPEVPADDTLLIGRVTAPEGRLRAVLVNYACHPTTLAWSNHAISPDYIGAMRETIEAAHPGTVSLFLQGASGELAPRYQYVGDPAVADRHGRQLAYAALAALEDMEPPGTRLAFEGVVESGAPLAVWRPQAVPPASCLKALRTTVALPLKPDLPTVQELDDQFRRCEDGPSPNGSAASAINGARSERDGVRTADLGLADRRCRPRRLHGRGLFPRPDIAARPLSGVHLVVMNLINGTIGYLSPADRYGENLYQVWQSPFAQGCLERYIEATAHLIERLLATPQPVTTT